MGVWIALWIVHKRRLVHRAGCLGLDRVMPIFILVFTALLLSAHGYLAFRVIRDGQLEGARRWAVIAVAVVAFGLLFVPYGLRGNPAGWAKALSLLGYMTLGVFGAAFFLTVAVDLVWLAGRGLDKLVPALPKDPERRRFLKSGLNLGALGTAAGVGLVGFAKARQLAEVQDVQVPIDGLPEELEGFTILQVSDIHVGPTVNGGQLQAIVDALNAQGADLVAITGDLVDGSVADLGPQVAALADIRATHGVVFSTGNHEYYSGAAEWCAHLQSALGVRVLVDEHVVLEHRGRRLVVGGVADLSAAEHLAEHRSDPHAALEGAPDGVPRVLLAHQPRSIYDAAIAGWDLVLSGHTHAGQFFPFTLLIHLAQPFVAGLHKVERSWLYVNRGTTYWGPPIRLGAAQEITRLVLTRA